MNDVLGGLFSSRLNMNLRETHGYTYGASPASASIALADRCLPGRRCAPT